MDDSPLVPSSSAEGESDTVVAMPLKAELMSKAPSSLPDNSGETTTNLEQKKQPSAASSFVTFESLATAAAPPRTMLAAPSTDDSDSTAAGPRTHVSFVELAAAKSSNPVISTPEHSSMATEESTTASSSVPPFAARFGSSTHVPTHVASSEEESVAELGDVSEGECSSLGDFHEQRAQAESASRFRRGEPAERDIAGVMAVAQRVASTHDEEFPMPLPVGAGLKCARFSEPADDCESLIDHPISTPPHLDSASPHSSQAASRASSTAPSSPSSAAMIRQPPTTPLPDIPVPGKLLKSAVTANEGVAASTAAALDHAPTSLPRFQEPRTCMWTSSHAANAPSEDRSSSLVNVLLQPLPPNFDSETQLPSLENDYHSLIRLNLWCVIDGHGGGSVATYASEVLLPHIAASISRALGCAIVSRGVCLVNGQLRDANAPDLDGLIETADRSPANPNSIHYRSPYEASDSEEEGADAGLLDGHLRPPGDDDDAATHTSGDHDSRLVSNAGTSAAAAAAAAAYMGTPLLRRPRSEGHSVSSVNDASVSSVKTSVKTAASTAARDAPVGTHSPSEVAAVTRAITESFLAVDEGWINSIDPVATHQNSCQSNGRWNSGACALTVFTIQRLEWTSVSDEHDRERELRGLGKARGHDTSQNKDAARRRMLDYAERAKSASSISTMSSTSSLTTTDGRVHTSGLESEITETEGEDDDHSTDNEKTARRRAPSRRPDREFRAPKESLITAPGGCSCHCYRAYDALLYTAHVGDCRAALLGSAPPRTIKVHGSAGHPDATDDESSHRSSDETECLSSSDHDADSSDDDEIELGTGKSASPAAGTPPAQAKTAAPTSSYMGYISRPARRSRRRLRDDLGMNAPFIALPPLEGFRSVEIEIDSDGDLQGQPHRVEKVNSDSSSSSENSRDDPPVINLPPVIRPIDLTTDHSAYNPAEVTAVLRRCRHAPRAISAGLSGGIKRVAGSLAVTRALGDAYLKTPMLSFFPYKRHAPYITARPEVNCRPIVKGGDKVLLLATDGVWERASGEDVLRWVRNFYAERIAEAERRKNRRLNQSERGSQPERASQPSNDGSVGGKKDDDSDDRNECDILKRRRDLPRSESPPAKRRKLRSGQQDSTLSQRNNSVADVIVRRVLNKVRRARNISSLHALMSLPPGRARRSKHDDITACVVDLSAFVS